MNRLITAAALLGMGLASLGFPMAYAQETIPEGISTNADGSNVTSRAGRNATANGEGETIIYGDITTGPGHTVIGPPSIERTTAPAPAPAPAPETAPAPTDATTATTTDQDADNIADELEWDLGLDPTNADSDGDNVADGDEITIYNTDPVAWDTDGDGLGDGEELFGVRTDPLVWTDEGAVASQDQPAASETMAQEAAGDAQPYQETAAVQESAPTSQSLPQGTTETLTAADGNAAARGPGDASASPGTVTRDGVTTSVLGPDGTYNVTETAPANVSISGDTEVLSPPTTAPAETAPSASESTVVTCGSYGSWYDAQIAYEAAGMTSADPALVASLDPDYDGIACEAEM